jgi:hypothetical protein
MLSGVGSSLETNKAGGETATSLYAQKKSMQLQERMMTDLLKNQNVQTQKQQEVDSQKVAMMTGMGISLNVKA